MGRRNVILLQVVTTTSWVSNEESLSTVILAHYYQDTEIQDVVDFVG